MPLYNVHSFGTAVTPTASTPTFLVVIKNPSTSPPIVISEIDVQCIGTSSATTRMEVELVRCDSTPGTGTAFTPEPMQQAYTAMFTALVSPSSTAADTVSHGGGNRDQTPYNTVVHLQQGVIERLDGINVVLGPSENIALRVTPGTDTAGVIWRIGVREGAI